jgi:REP element-mobilizing transposase RayT
LRGKQAFKCLHRAAGKARRRGLAIIHYSVLSNHIHLVLEAGDRLALALQMQSLGVSFAKQLNARLSRKGPVLRERYHVHVLKTPREVKHALSYVISNELKHTGRTGRIAVDEFSSAITLPDSLWSELFGHRWRNVVGFPEEMDPGETREIEISVRNLLSPPKTWLLREGWARA